MIAEMSGRGMDREKEDNRRREEMEKEGMSKRCSRGGGKGGQPSTQINTANLERMQGEEAEKRGKI